MAGAFNLTAILEGIINGLDVAPPHLVAHSMGGRFALELAIARPDLISSLTVIELALAPDAEVHYPFVYNPEAFNEVLLDFLRQP